MHHKLTFGPILVVRRPRRDIPLGGPKIYLKALAMDDPKQSPFALNRGRLLILILGVLVVLITISMWLGGIDAYQALRSANAEATTATPGQTPDSQRPAE